MSCEYTGVSGYLLYFTLQIPLLVTVSLSALGLMASHRNAKGQWVGESFFLLYGLWLNYWHWLLYIFQDWLAEFVPPLCSDDTALWGFAFPSVEGYYVGAIVFGFLAYRICTGHPQTYTRYTYIALVFLVPSATLIWFRGIVWWQVLLSVIYGGFVATTFILLLKRYLSFRLNAVLNVWPISLLSLKDTYVVTQSDDPTSSTLITKGHRRQRRRPKVTIKV